MARLPAARMPCKPPISFNESINRRRIDQMPLLPTGISLAVIHRCNFRVEVENLTKRYRREFGLSASFCYASST